ncbi:MAG TPA: dihydropteroate synthase [Kofleriaceae bacterium]|nr:dihydropteroate synthase [Kofleriaceae bacterium]
MTGLAIRPVRPDEWRTWRDLRLRALADAPDAFGETLAESQNRDEAAWRSWVAPRADAIRLVAVRDGVPVGMMVVAIAEDARRANVYAMWVAPEARRAGAGRRLIETGLTWARQQAALDVELRVSDGQSAARALYESCGLRSTGDRGGLRDGSPVLCDTMAIRLPPLVMGVVNVTPDSFSDGGVYLDPAAAVAHGLELAAAGADILDVGGEATNPRATGVGATEELRRVLPVIERLVAAGARVSIDTTKAEVARAAVGAGASIINDVSGGLFDPAMAGVLAGVTYVAGHLRGRTLAEVFAAEAPASWREVADELGARIRALPEGTRVWGDPGIGFGKGADPEGNAELLRHAGDIAAALRRPIVVGPSRKRFLRRLLGMQEPDIQTLDAASVLASLAAVRAGAQVVRVHNVALLHMHLTAYNKK